MHEPDPPPAVTAALVDTLLSLAGLPAQDAPTLARIASGAGQAFDAVRAGRAGVDFDQAPDLFLAELDRLADDRD